jgi:hypothetical protein
MTKLTDTDTGGANGAPPRLRLRTPQDLIDAVPYLLGFHPRDSAVLVGMRARGPSQVPVVARMDLRDLDGGASWVAARDLEKITGFDDQPPIGGDLFEAGALAENALRALRHSGSTSAIGVVFSEDTADDVLGPVSTLQAASVRVGLPVTQWLLVGSVQWRLIGDDENFFGDSNPAHHRSGAVSAVAAEAIYAGLVAHADRNCLASTLAVCPDARAATMGPLLERARVTRLRRTRNGVAQRQSRGDIRALFAASRQLPAFDDVQLAAFAVALRDITVRDACWLGIEGNRIDGELLWRELARSVPAPYDAAPLFLFGWIRWRHGDGTMAGIAARRALDGDPDYHAANLLESAVGHGLDPFQTPRLRKGA